MNRLATVELQLVLQLLPLADFLRCARCSHLMHDAADVPFASQHLSIAWTSTEVCQWKVPLRSLGPLRHAPCSLLWTGSHLKCNAFYKVLAKLQDARLVAMDCSRTMAPLQHAYVALFSHHAARNLLSVTLIAGLIDEERAASLARLQQLQSLVLHGLQNDWFLPPPSFRPVVRLRSLTSLTLVCVGGSDGHCEELHSLPQLSLLSFEAVSHVSQWIAQLPVLFFLRRLAISLRFGDCYFTDRLPSLPALATLLERSPSLSVELHLLGPWLPYNGGACISLAYHAAPELLDAFRGRLMVTADPAEQQRMREQRCAEIIRMLPTTVDGLERIRIGTDPLPVLEQPTPA